MSDKHVRILIPLEDQKLPNERVWAVPHASIPNVYRVENVPLSPCGIAYHDWVECAPPRRKDNKVPRVRHVYQSGGYGSVFAQIDEKRSTRAADFFAIVEALEKLDWPLESMNDAFWLIAAVPPGEQKTAEALFKRHPTVEFDWTIDPLSYDPMQHPTALPVSIKTLTDAWTALTRSFEHSSYSPHDDLSDETRAALKQLGSLFEPLMKTEEEGEA